jgi:hypothetical protein
MSDKTWAAANPAGAQRVRQGARSADAGAPAPPPNCATQDVRRRNTATPALARTWPFLLGILLAACAPGERLGVLEQGVCVCPAESDAGPDAAPDAGAPDAAPHQRTRLHYLADSVPVVGASDVAHRAVTLIAASYPAAFTNQAVGGRSMNFYAYDAARRSTVAHVIAVGPPNGPLPLASDVWIALGYNDWAGAIWTAAEYGAAYDDLVTRLLAELGPGGRVYCQTSTSAASNLNARGETLAQFDAATATACARPGAYVVPGSLVGLLAEDRLDVAHLKDSGHAKLAAFTAAMGGW